MSEEKQQKKKNKTKQNKVNKNTKKKTKRGKEKRLDMRYNAVRKDEEHKVFLFLLSVILFCLSRCEFYHLAKGGGSRKLDDVQHIPVEI